jgi:hypothetical protein
VPLSVVAVGPPGEAAICSDALTGPVVVGWNRTLSVHDTMGASDT